MLLLGETSLQCISVVLFQHYNMKKVICFSLRGCRYQKLVAFHACPWIRQIAREIVSQVKKLWLDVTWVVKSSETMLLLLKYIHYALLETRPGNPTMIKTCLYASMQRERAEHNVSIMGTYAFFINLLTSSQSNVFSFILMICILPQCSRFLFS